MSVSARKISETPIAIIDFETTGLTPGHDRVVEASVVRIDPGQPPKLVFDSLINPVRRMAATEIHGITDAAVAHAPKFQDVAGELVAATHGCVVAAYNVYFDVKFLKFELSNAGVSHDVPHFCLMYLRTMLGLGGRCKLDEACRALGIDFSASHVAAHDAMAGGQLMQSYLDLLRRKEVSTFAQMARLKNYKFSESFVLSPLPDPGAFGLSRSSGMVSRAGFAAPVDPVRQAVANYWDALRAVLADLDVSDDEVEFVRQERLRGGLHDDQVRVLHARAFASVMSQFADDQRIDDREARKLRRLHECLAKLGWAPGQ